MNPCAPSKIGRKRPAIDQAGVDKRRKYADKAEERNHRFAPLAFETHGDMSGEVTSLIGQLASNTPSGVGYSMFTMQTDLALTLARGNAYCAKQVFARAQRRERQLREG